MVANLHPDGPDALILHNGKEFKKVDSESFHHRDHGPQKQCFMNAGKAALNGEGTYVEGYITLNGVPIQHAWIINDNEKVKDLTLKNKAGVGTYFGIPFKTTFLAKTVSRTGTWGLLDYRNYQKIKFDNFKEEKFTKPYKK